MNKVVYNACYGGFGLSNKAVIEICKRKNIPVFFYKEDFGDDWDETIFTRISEEEAANTSDFSVVKCTVDYGESFKRTDPIYQTFNENYIGEPIDSRHDPILVQVVEELGSAAASGEYAKLQIFETESDLYRIDEYDGQEYVATPISDGHSYTRIK